jgi:hypothetical protein
MHVCAHIHTPASPLSQHSAVSRRAAVPLLPASDTSPESATSSFTATVPMTVANKGMERGEQVKQYRECQKASTTKRIHDTTDTRGCNSVAITRPYQQAALPPPRRRWRRVCGPQEDEAGSEPGHGATNTRGQGQIPTQQNALQKKNTPANPPFLYTPATQGSIGRTSSSSRPAASPSPRSDHVPSAHSRAAATRPARPVACAHRACWCFGCSRAKAVCKRKSHGNEKQNGYTQREATATPLEAY